MQIVRVPTANGIDDIKLIGESELESQFIKQLAEAGTLSCVSRQVGDSILFRAISVTSEISSYTSTRDSIGKYDFTIRQNENHNFDLTFNKDAVAINLAQFSSIKLQVKHSKSAPALIELTVGSGLTISGVDNNILSIAITADQAKVLTCESYYYDILMSKPTSNVYYVEGKVNVKQTGTR
jgi:hypothetical protein